MPKKKNRNRQVSNLVSRIDPSQLNQLYTNSIRSTPELHHPSIVAGTPSEDHVRRDFTTWFAGVQSGLKVCQQVTQQGRQEAGVQPGQQYGQPLGGPTIDLFSSRGAQSTLFQMPEQHRRNLPNNITQALQMAIGTLSTSRRAA